MTEIKKYSDEELIKKIEQAKAVTQAWCNKHDLWYDCCFRSWIEHFDDEPGVDTAHLLLCVDGHLCDVFNYDYDDLCEELRIELDKINCHFELYDHTTISFWFEDDEGEIQKAFTEYFEWEWLCSLLNPDYSLFYEEIFKRFSNNPSELYNLEPRNFEKLLENVFSNLGYRTELGSGSGDGGIDLKLFSNGIVGEVLTIIQAKRYKDTYPIKLEAVQALFGALIDGNANKGIFVTTSRFLPSARKFAERQNNRITLATSKEVQEWCENANKNIIKSKVDLVSRSSLENILNEKNKSKLVGRIFHTTYGVNMIDNLYALLLKETNNIALMLIIDHNIVEHDGYGQRGTHVPDLSKVLKKTITSPMIFRGKKIYNEGMVFSGIWGRRELWSLWNGKPNHFDLCD